MANANPPQWRKKEKGIVAHLNEVKELTPELLKAIHRLLAIDELVNREEASSVSSTTLVFRGTDLLAEEKVRTELIDRVWALSRDQVAAIAATNPHFMEAYAHARRSKRTYQTVKNILGIRTREDLEAALQGGVLQLFRPQTNPEGVYVPPRQQPAPPRRQGQAAPPPRQ